MKDRLYQSLLIAIALCVAGWTAHAQMQRRGTAKQTWEYKVILMGRVTDTQRDPQWLTDGLSEIGAEGWELVAIDPASSTAMGSQSSRYCFKRPK
jgi:hypothetical protein